MQHDLNDMMVFLAVVETGGFTLASQRLGVPKANVSRKVSRLEQDLGVKLLERSTRSQHLTEAGKRYLIHCKRIHEEVDLAKAAVSEELHSFKGNLKVGTSVTIGQQIIKPVLPAFLHQFPKLNVELSLVNKRIDLIEEGFDMLIRVGTLDDSRLIAKCLGKARRRLFASKNYFKEGKLPEIPDDLYQFDILLMNLMNKSNTLNLISGRQQQVLKVNPRLISDDFSILKQSVVDGLGIAVLPEYMCSEDVAKGELITVLPNWGMQDIDIYALYPQHRVKIPKVKAFLEFTVKTFAKRLIC